MSANSSVSHRRGIRYQVGPRDTPSPIEARQREITRLTRGLVKLERERRKLRKRLLDITREMRIMRRAQKIVLAPVFTPADVVEFDSAKPEGK